MEEAQKAIYQAIRDDSAASIGVRALLGNTTTTPYNVYYAFLPVALEFSPASGTKQGFVVVLLISSVADLSAGKADTRLMQDVYQVSVYARDLSKVREVHSRIRWRLEGKRGLTDPTTDDVIHKIALESIGPDRYDDAYECRWQTAIYRVWRRDDDLR